MQQPTPTTPDVSVEIGMLLIDRAHHHRLVEVIEIPDENHIRLRPIRDFLLHPPSYLETATRLAANYQQVGR